MNNNWLKQTVEAPLYDKLLWSRPENKLRSGRILVIGGSSHGFSKTVNSYERLLAAGIGQVTILLPKSVQKLLGHISDDVIYCPNTDSGSFSSEALSDMLDFSNTSDGIFLSGELSNNSQTLVVIEKLVSRTSKPIIITDDSIDLALHFDPDLINRDNMIFAGTLDKVQKLLIKLKSTQSLTSNLALSNLVEVLQNFTTGKRLAIVTIHQDYVIVAREGQVVTTKIELSKSESINRLIYQSACWIIQNPNNKFEALSCASISCQN
jgi:NAD(P)H-hydrate repair Nnr-like enzyme with NAD(P)H-hydrate dehydratase domain